MFMKIIVTGGAGFLGSHVVEHFFGEGYTVIVIDDLSSGSLENISSLLNSDKLIFVKADISDFKELYGKTKKYLDKNEVAGIIHLAALTNIAEAEKNPQRALDVNVKGTLNIVEVGRKADIDRIIYASSAAVYGESKYLPIDEEHLLDPVNMCGLTKLMGEQIIFFYGKQYGMKPVALRFFNIYGPCMRKGLYASVIHNFITSMPSNQSPTIYGDGTQTRDFIYVEDAVLAIEKALNIKTTGIFNIGSGIEISIYEIYRIVCNIINRCLEPKYLPRRKGDVKRSKASNKKAKSILKWEPKTSIEQGLMKTIQYYFTNNNYIINYETLTWKGMRTNNE